MNKADISQLIAQNRLEEALRALLALASGTHHDAEAKHLSARYHELARQERLGMEPPAELERSRNRITHSLLQLLEELPDEAAAPPRRLRTALWVGAAAVAGLLGFWFFRQAARPAGPISLTVSLRVQRPSADYPDLKDAELWLWLENEWRKSPISPEGTADFKNLPPALLGQRSAVQLKAAHYRLALDSLTIQPPSVMLELLPDGSLERVHGKVRDPLGKALPGVVIEVEGLLDTTDAAGHYDLRIPLASQKTHYVLEARRLGNKSEPTRVEVWPASGAGDFSLR